MVVIETDLKGEAVDADFLDIGDIARLEIGDEIIGRDLGQRPPAKEKEQQDIFVHGSIIKIT